MTRSYLAIAMLACSATFASFSSTIASAGQALDRAWTRALAFVLDVFSESRPRQGNGGFTGLLVRGPRLAYDGPPLNELRHEAHVSRRSADRHT